MSAIRAALAAAGLPAVPPIPSETWDCLKVRSRYLSDDEVRAIRREYVPYKVSTYDLAERYGTSHNTVWQIIHRISYQHVPDEGGRLMVTSPPDVQDQLARTLGHLDRARDRQRMVDAIRRAGRRACSTCDDELPLRCMTNVNAGVSATERWVCIDCLWPQGGN